MGVMREDRHCDMCSMNTLGDEYHLFFECNNPDVEMLRRQYIPIYYRNHRSIYNFIKLMKKIDDIKIGKRISNFVKKSKVV